MIALLVAATVAAAQSTCAPGANCSVNQSGGTSIGTQNNYYSPELTERHVTDLDVQASLAALPPKEQVINVGFKLANDGLTKNRALALEICLYIKSKGYISTCRFDTFYSRDPVQGVVVRYGGQPPYVPIISIGPP
jgi:hypothetical protein